jgi:ribonucleoside-diphosphate reductase alpha chain
MGTLRADLPYDKVRLVRERNRRLGLGLMGVHEWLLQRKQKYEVTPELHKWLATYEGASNAASRHYANKLGISTPIANRSIAPTGTIGIIAGTTTGIEPVFASAYKRRYLSGTKWKYQYQVDYIAQQLAEQVGVNPDDIDTAEDMAKDYERRIAFQADIQDYVDQGISSTINLPEWGSDNNNEDTAKDFARVLANYSHRLRGFTCFPSGSRGAQPLTKVSYAEAVEKLGEEFEDHIEVNENCAEGICGI